MTPIYSKKKHSFKRSTDVLVRLPVPADVCAQADWLINKLSDLENWSGVRAHVGTHASPRH